LWGEFASASVAGLIATTSSSQGAAFYLSSARAGCLPTASATEPDERFRCEAADVLIKSPLDASLLVTLPRDSAIEFSS
jgi:hypothetical protein